MILLLLNIFTIFSKWNANIQVFDVIRKFIFGNFKKMSTNENAPENENEDAPENNEELLHFTIEEIFEICDFIKRREKMKKEAAAKKAAEEEARKKQGRKQKKREKKKDFE